MKKFQDILLNVLFGILTVIIILLLSIIIFVLIFDFSRGIEKILIAGASILLSLLLVFLFKKEKMYGAIVLMVSSAMASFLCYNGVLDIISEKRNVWMNYTTLWKNENHAISMPFFVSPTGHIYLKVKINGEKKYLSFDTGSLSTVLHEKYIASKLMDTIVATSSQARNDKMSVHKLDILSLGDLTFRKLTYTALKKDAWDSCGIFYNQDSIAGIIGRNIINNFVWDFDMVNHKVYVKDNPYLDSITNSRIVPLSRLGMGWCIDVIVNNNKKKVILDSGNNMILNITDTIKVAKTYTYSITNAGKSKGIFSYLDCNGNAVKIDSNSINKSAKRRVFANLGIADTLYKETFVVDRSTSNLLGVPLFWEYERVVLDFINKKMFLVNPVKRTNVNQISVRSRKELWKTKLDALSQSGYYEIYYKEAIKIKTKTKFTLDTMVFSFKGKTKVFGTVILNKSDQVETFEVDSIKGRGYIRNNKSNYFKEGSQIISLRLRDNIILENQNLIEVL
ncbi:pepsin/retropepsin-like aspartic protease family protein [Snuella sedimenti]|uniref:Aspartyl protease n=1 Tax=Snuella sedimenti TaxID=2798802 RepID=A0A8J7J3G0_9FLAO|nr:hypothetical protein [Snuella sedimenti]MBJ6369067.1 hypothetical protein [Snuella sedimenti]